MNSIMNTIIKKNDYTIIAVDHGFGNIKTAHSCFRTGVTACDKKPILTSDMLVYNGKYYIIGEEHKEFVPDKMSDPDYYILTLAAIARELYLQNRASARVYLAVGLPLTWVSEQRDDFKAYLLRNEAVDFNYKGTDYHVEFAGASVYPQGFAAVASVAKRFQGLHMLCDIEVIRTLHVEDLFNVLYLKGTDAVSGATVVSFTNPDGSAQQVEEVEAPAEDEIVTRTYTLENAMDKEITELYVYKSKGENLVPDGLQPGEQVQAEVFGYYLHTPNETLYTVEYTTEGDKFVNTYSIRTLHVEDLFEVLYLTGADAVAGATPVAFAKPEK